MAEPASFPEANLLLLGPAGADDPDVQPLPARRLDGMIVSCWRPSAAELAEIQETGCIWLSIWGMNTQPPVYVTGHRAEVI